MKKAILTVAMVSSSVFAHAQYVNGIFTTQIKNGVGVEVTMSFEADSTKIVNSQTYATFFKQSNVPLYAEKNPELDSLELFLKHEVNLQSLMTRLKLNNGTSFEPINVPANMIYLNQEGDINISYVFKAQNGYGNLIMGKAIATSTTKDEKINRTVFIY